MPVSLPESEALINGGHRHDADSTWSCSIHVGIDCLPSPLQEENAMQRLFLYALATTSPHELAALARRHPLLGHRECRALADAALAIADQGAITLSDHQRSVCLAISAGFRSALDD